MTTMLIKWDEAEYRVTVLIHHQTAMSQVMTQLSAATNYPASPEEKASISTPASRWRVHCHNANTLDEIYGPDHWSKV